MILETERLALREYTWDDFEVLYEMLSDPELMRYYPRPYDEQGVKAWIWRNMDRYARDGFGLWAVILKETGEMIGDCGITLQNIHGQMLPEIGYHIRKKYQRQGYAAEAAAGCIKYAFEQLDFPRVYSYMKYTNEPSARTAMKNGMKFVEEYDDPVNVRTRVYALDRQSPA